MFVCVLCRRTVEAVTPQTVCLCTTTAHALKFISPDTGSLCFHLNIPPGLRQWFSLKWIFEKIREKWPNRARKFDGCFVGWCRNECVRRNWFYVFDIVLIVIVYEIWCDVWWKFFFFGGIDEKCRLRGIKLKKLGFWDCGNQTWISSFAVFIYLYNSKKKLWTSQI